MYRRVRRHSSSALGGTTLQPVEDFDGFSEVAVPMLLAVGPYAYNDAVLLYKVIRIIKAALGIVSYS